MMLPLLLLSLWIVPIQSSPMNSQFQNATTTYIIQGNRTTGWSDSPSYRGTMDIIWSCLVTIFASIYTALHPNINLHRTSKWKRLAIRLHWAVLCLFNPPVIVHWTLSQYLEARKLYGKLKASRIKCSRTESMSTSGHQCQVEYSMSYAWWVVMGGFVIDTGNIHDDFKRVALTSSGVAFLAQHGRYIPLSKERIADYSKADAATKFVACIQISWFLIQAAARLSAGYPLTLLEIHTSIQVVCALMIYASCWHKPFDVEAPIVVDASDFEDLVAYMMMASLPIERAAWSDYIVNDRTHLFERLPTVPTGNGGQRSEPTLPATDNRYFDIDHVELNMLNFNSKLLLSNQSVHEQQENTDHSGSADILEKSPSLSVLQVHSLSPANNYFFLDSSFVLETSSTTLNRWRLCVQALIKLNLVGLATAERCIRGDKLCKNYVTVSKTAGSVQLRVTRQYFETRFPFGRGIIFAMMYGSVLLGLWRYDFPSPVEALLWKMSAITTFAQILMIEPLGPSFHFLCLVFPGMRSFPSSFSVPSSNNSYRQSFINSWRNLAVRNWHTHRSSELTSESAVESGSSFSHYHNHKPISYAWRSQNARMKVLTVICCFNVVSVHILLAFCSIYLVLESFISLRAIPVEALSTVPWTQAIPHV